MDRLSARIDVARELALNGTAGPARTLCGTIFLEQAPLLRHASLLGAYVECLLLLEMAALLPRVILAVHGVAFDMSVLAEPGPRRWLLTFGNGVMLTMDAPGPRADRSTRAEAASRWSALILAAAGRDPVSQTVPVRALEHAI